MIGRLIGRFVREQDGITLVIAIATMCVLAIATTGVIVAGTANEDTAWVSTKGRSAFAVAQQALAYGEGMVYAQVAAGQDPPADIQSLPTQPNGATGSYWALTGDGITWQVFGTGTMNDVSRTVSAYVTPAQTVTTQQLAIWNYLYADSNMPCDAGHGISGGATISIPILTGGDIGICGTTKILGSLEVAGKLNTSGSAQIGSASSPISRLAIANPMNDACNILGQKTAVGVGTCDGLHAGAYASSVGKTLSTTTGLPTVDFAAAYAAQAALTKTGCPPKLFDNNTTKDNGNSANISTLLFGSTDYDCYVGTNHLRWDHTTKQLTASGTFYFDGTLNAPTGVGAIVYSGLASFYFSGGVIWDNGSLCGISGCGTNWDTASNVLFVVAQCTGLTAGCVAISGGNTVQFGVYATENYKVSGGSGNMAPVICDTFAISGGTDLLVPIQKFPPNVPSPTTSVAYTGTPPTGWSG